MTISFSGYKIRELWKNLIFFGSGLGWDPSALIQEPLQDGLGNSIGLAIFPDRLVASKPVQLLGSITLPNGTVITLSPSTTSVQLGSKSSAIVSNQISVSDGSTSLRLKPHSFIINNVEYQVQPDQLSHDFSLTAQGAIRALALVTVSGQSALESNFALAKGIAIADCTNGSLCKFCTFGGVIVSANAIVGQIWWAISLGGPITNVYSPGLKAVGISPADGLILLWRKDKLE